MGEFCDEHDLGEFEERTYPVEFDVRVPVVSKLYVSLERDVAEALRNAAAGAGVSTETLVNNWRKETIEHKSFDKSRPLTPR